MSDFLLELLSEEIPARMQDRARADLARLFAGEMAKAGLRAGEVVTHATPRRLALIARGLPAQTQAVREEVKGPRASAPPQALEGFLRKTGLTREALTERDGVFHAVIETPGRATADVLAEAVPAIVRAFPWPKSMRWGAASVSNESLRWVRPLQGIVAILDEAVVPIEVAGVASGDTTAGHRFHHRGPVRIAGAGDYVETLRAAHVIVDQDERRAIIRDRAAALAAEAGLSVVEDEGLVAENAGLTEWPVPLLGRFDPAFLSVPAEVIQLTARVNQKYFVCRDAAGALADAFVCTANIAASDGGAAIVAGNRKVLAARLADARFFFETDLKTPLQDLLPRLEKIVFHEKLGTVADKVERVAKLARWLVEEGIVGGARALPNTVIPAQAGISGEGAGTEALVTPAFAGVTGKGAGEPYHSPASEGGQPDDGLRRGTLADLAGRAARLAKADLVTGMVGEFPELQGVMGGYYAAAQGEDPRVAAAIRDHYKPVGQGDDVPTDPVTVAVSLADKLDSIAAFFRIEEFPTGSKDPFALRRAALATIRIVETNHIRLALADAFDRSLSSVEASSRIEALGAGNHRGRGFGGGRDGLPYFILDFFADRLKVQQREAGVRHDLIDAVFALGGEDDLVRLLARVRALQGFMASDDGANLLAGYKRAANILKKEGWDEAAGTPDSEAALSYTPEPAEQALIAALDAAAPRAEAAVGREDFEGAMAALASLRVPIDAFFEGVTVNDADPAKRAARLALLGRVRAAVHAVADFSRIEG